MEAPPSEIPGQVPEMVDRVAQALYETPRYRGQLLDQAWRPWSDVGENDRALWYALARIAITAMREPTEAMVVAGVHHENMGDMTGRWQAMINAALGR